jgi:DNA-binding transcriptional LysR family regulator
MELYQIRHFIAVVEAGGFTKGAERAAVSQPAISASIAKLEEELDVKLLDRRHSPIVPTPAGRRLLEAGKELLQRYNAIKADIKSITDPKLLKIGVEQSLLLFDGDVSELLTSFHHANPHLPTEVIDDRCEQMVKLLGERELDAVITVLNCKEMKFAELALFEMPYKLAVREDHRFARRQAVKLEDLENEPFILPTRGVNLEDLTNALVSRGIQIRVASQTDNVYRALALVASGIGVALVPGHFMVASVKYVPIPELNIRRTVGVLWQRERKSGALKEFISFAERHCLGAVAAAG